MEWTKSLLNSSKKLERPSTKNNSRIEKEVAAHQPQSTESMSMDKGEAQRIWEQVTRAVEQQISSESFKVGLSSSEFTLIHDRSSGGVCSAKILNCALDSSSHKVICRPIEIISTVKDFKPKVEIELSCEAGLAHQRILELYQDFIESDQ